MKGIIIAVVLAATVLALPFVTQTITQEIVAPVSPGGGGGGIGKDTKPTRIYDISLCGISGITADICWTTNEKSTSQVRYWSSSKKVSPFDETYVNFHSVTLTDLTLGTTYTYEVMSEDKAGNLAVSEEYSFTTLGEKPTEPEPIVPEPEEPEPIVPEPEEPVEPEIVEPEVVEPEVVEIEKVAPLDGESNPVCQDKIRPCHLCDPQDQPAYIMLVGAGSYPTPQDFVKEALAMGISKRIPFIPKGLELGKTVVYLAHPKACEVKESAILQEAMAIVEEAQTMKPRLLDAERIEKRIGIFCAFIPKKVEKLIWESKATPEELERLQKREITPIIVPDGDADHA